VARVRRQLGREPGHRSGAGRAGVALEGGAGDPSRARPGEAWSGGWRCLRGGAGGAARRPVAREWGQPSTVRGRRPAAGWWRRCGTWCCLGRTRQVRRRSRGSRTRVHRWASVARPRQVAMEKEYAQATAASRVRDRKPMRRPFDEEVSRRGLDSRRGLRGRHRHQAGRNSSLGIA
jgi:hypothetical protein